MGDSNVLIYACPNGLWYARLGVVVSRRLGNAVVRNRFKRRVREAFRTTQHDLPRDLDVICIPRPGPPRSVENYASSLRRMLPALRRRMPEHRENES
jgi:ribonuclease P protein component